MLIAGIIGSEGQLQTASLINSILASMGKKVSIIDSSSLFSYDGPRIKAYISELERNNIDLLLLKTGISDIDNFLMDEIKFDIVIYTDKAVDTENKEKNQNPEKIHSPDKSRSPQKMERVFSLMADKGVAIVNVDDSDLINLLQGMKHQFVTYGFNKKASITTSSIGDTVSKEGFICCLQRTIAARNGTVIEPQEYKLKLDVNDFDSHNLLAAASFAIINGIDLNNVGGFQTI